MTTSDLRRLDRVSKLMAFGQYQWKVNAFLPCLGRTLESRLDVHPNSRNHQNTRNHESSISKLTKAGRLLDYKSCSGDTHAFVLVLKIVGESSSGWFWVRKRPISLCARRRGSRQARSELEAVLRNQQCLGVDAAVSIEISDPTRNFVWFRLYFGYAIQILMNLMKVESNTNFENLKRFQTSPLG